MNNGSSKKKIRLLRHTRAGIQVPIPIYKAIYVLHICSNDFILLLLLLLYVVRVCERLDNTGRLGFYRVLRKCSAATSDAGRREMKNGLFFFRRGRRLDAAAAEKEKTVVKSI